MIRPFLALALLLPAAALAQGGQPLTPVPEALRGAWFAGDCATPATMLVLSARAAARVPSDGPARLLRFTETRAASGWTIGTGRGAEAPRLLLRAAGDGLETAEPTNKTRDDRLPGEAPVTAWRRCPATPLPFAAQGEGVAFLGSIEVLEAACGPGSGSVPDCAAAIIRVGDVSGDNLLGTAELARLFRGAAWLISIQSEAGPELAGLAGGAGTLGGLAAAKVALESLDYDGDGRLSARELAQDRTTLATTGDARGRPLALERLSEGVSLLRGVIEGLLGTD